MVTYWRLIGDSNTNYPQSPLTHALHNLARTLNVPLCQHFLTNLCPTVAQQHDHYIRAATICPCPVIKIIKPGTPHMCEYCDLLQPVIRKSPTNDSPACALPLTDAHTLFACSICILYALIHQNTFAQRWTTVQTTVPTTRNVQIHASLHSPQRMECATPPRKRGIPIQSDIPIATVNTPPSTHMSVNLTLTETTRGTISQILTMQPATHRCTRVHIPHPVMPITTGHLVKIQGIIRSGSEEQLPLPLLYHHFRLTTLSDFIPDDRTLELTVDIAVHLLTTPRTTSVARPHHLHLNLNPHDRHPYLQHTYNGTGPSSYRLIIITSLQSDLMTSLVEKLLTARTLEAQWSKAGSKRSSCGLGYAGR